MSDHFVNYSSEEGLHQNARLLDIMKEIGPEDELIITMDGDDEAQEAYIFSLLRENGFEILPKGSHDGRQYHIIAHRRKQ